MVCSAALMTMSPTRPHPVGYSAVDAEAVVRPGSKSAVRS